MSLLRRALPAILGVFVETACVQSGDPTTPMDRTQAANLAATSLGDGGAADCNVDGTCTHCAPGFYLAYASAGGSFCNPIQLETPCIQLVSDGNDASTCDPCVRTSLQSREIRTKFCAGCHGGGGAHMGSFDFVLDDRKLLSSVSVATHPDGAPWRFLVAGDPESSRLFDRANRGLKAHAGDMPPIQTDPTLPPIPRPTVSDVAVLRFWIENCVWSLR